MATKKEAKDELGTAGEYRKGSGEWYPDDDTFYVTEDKDEVLSSAKYLGYGTGVWLPEDEAKAIFRKNKTDDAEYYIKSNGEWKKLTTLTTINADPEKYEDRKIEEIEKAITYK